MTAKGRIIAVRLSDRLSRNAEYAKQLGICITYRTTAEIKAGHMHKNKNNRQLYAPPVMTQFTAKETGYE